MRVADEENDIEEGEGAQEGDNNRQNASRREMTERDIEMAFIRSFMNLSPMQGNPRQRVRAERELAQLMEGLLQVMMCCSCHCMGPDIDYFLQAARQRDSVRQANEQRRQERLRNFLSYPVYTFTEGSLPEEKSS